MAETPDSEMRERLRALCSQITVAEELDPEIQEELLTHMEDKLNAYLHGSEPVMEEDAYLLVREHFGDPLVVKSLLQETYDDELRLSLGRRLAAIASVTLALFASWRALLALGESFAVWSAQEFPSHANMLSYARNGANLFFYILVTPFVWIVVRRWRLQLDQGERPWFLRWSTRSLVLLVACLVLTFFYIPVVQGSIPETSSTPHWINALFFAGLGLVWVSMIAQSMVWLWWCDRPPRTKRTLSYTSMVWALVGSCISIQGAILTISETQREHFALLSFASNDGQLHWSLRFATSIYEMGIGAMASFALFAVFSWVARAIYAGAKSWQTKKVDDAMPVE